MVSRLSQYPDYERAEIMATIAAVEEADTNDDPVDIYPKIQGA